MRDWGSRPAPSWPFCCWAASPGSPQYRGGSGIVNLSSFNGNDTESWRGDRDSHAAAALPLISAQMVKARALATR